MTPAVASASIPEPKTELIDAPEGYPFPKRAEGLLPWRSALAQLEQAENYWLATTRPDGRPHVAPLWGAWIDDAFYFDGLSTTRWARNIQQNPSASLNLESGSSVVIVEGVVDVVVTDDALAARIVAAWRTKYGKMESAPSTDGVYRLRPRTARAWGDSLQDGARWVFPRADVD